MLEVAGFSSSNPFYIVQQNRVQALTAMTDAQRLDLLKEVAGTRVYDEKREQTERTLHDAGVCACVLLFAVLLPLSTFFFFFPCV